MSSSQATPKLACVPANPLTARIAAEFSAAGDGAAEPRRQRALAALSDVGLPTLRDENWKYVNLRPLEKVRFAPPSTEARPAIQASDLGKFKMLVQIVSVVAVILDHHWKEWPIYGHYFLPIHWIASLAIWFMVCVSLVSAVDYFVAFWSKIDRQASASRRRRRPFVLSRRKRENLPSGETQPNN